MSIFLVSFVFVADLESLILFNLKKYLLRKIYVSWLQFIYECGIVNLKYSMVVNNIK